MNELTINLNSRSKKPLYEQIYDHIKSDIQNGRLRYGEKLPSTRALSKHLEVSRSTVELAYEQLLSEGYIESAPYRGFFVAQIDELYQLKKEEKKPEVENQFVYTNLEEQMKSLIGTKVSVHAKANGKGKIEIEYYSPDDLERIYELLMTIQHN